MTVPEPRSGANRRTLRFRRKLAAVVGSCAVVSAVAVGVGANSASATDAHTAALSGNLSITFNTFDYSTLNTILQSWEKLHPGVHVTVADVSNNPSTYVPLLQSEQSAGDQPDINEAYDVLDADLRGRRARCRPQVGSHLEQHVCAEVLVPLVRASYIPPKGATGGVTVGDPYGVPLEADATVILYNKKELAAAHVPFPKDGWTWNQMLADAKKLRKGSGATQKQYGICLRPDWQAEYNPSCTRTA